LFSKGTAVCGRAPQRCALPTAHAGFPWAAGGGWGGIKSDCGLLKLGWQRGEAREAKKQQQNQ